MPNNYKVGIEIETDTNDSGKKIGGVASAAEGLGDAFGEGLGSIDAFGMSLGDLVNPATLTTGLVAGIGAALIETGANAMDLSKQVDTSTALMQTQLGLTDESAGAFHDTLRAIYEDNYGEDFEGIAASMTAVEQQFQRIGGTENQAQLQAVTEQAIAFGDAFGEDVGASTSAAVTLMDNFKISADEAFNILTAGEQQGLNASGDFLDSIGEYSVQFSQAGADAGQFFSVLQTGNQGGVLGTDKVADAFKEFGIRIVDNSTTTKTALTSIGIDYDNLKKGFADGSITQVDAMQTVIDKINEIEDPVQKNIAGVALFGTQWEDLTEQVLTGIDTQKTGLEDLEGAAASLQDQYEHTGTAGGNAMREWNNALVDVGDGLNSLKDLILPGITFALETLVIPKVHEFADWLKTARDIGVTIGGWLGSLMGGGGAPVAPSSFDVTSSSIPVAAPALAAAGQGLGTQIYQQFYIERGDPVVVQSAASMGLSQAQRSRGE